MISPVHHFRAVDDRLLAVEGLLAHQVDFSFVIAVDCPVNHIPGRLRGLLGERSRPETEHQSQNE